LRCVLLFLACSSLSLPWHRHLFGIATGLTIVITIDVVSLAIALRYGQMFAMTYNWAKSIAYLCCVRIGGGGADSGGYRSHDENACPALHSAPVGRHSIPANHNPVRFVCQTLRPDDIKLHAPWKFVALRPAGHLISLGGHYPDFRMLYRSTLSTMRVMTT
jgi:hypothetical protein